MSDKFLLPTSKSIVTEVFTKIRQKFKNARDEMLASIKKTLSNKEIKKKNTEIIKDNAKEGIKKKLAHYNEVLKENNISQRSHHDRGGGEIDASFSY